MLISTLQNPAVGGLVWLCSLRPLAVCGFPPNTNKDMQGRRHRQTQRHTWRFRPDTCIQTHVHKKIYWQTGMSQLHVKHAWLGKIFFAYFWVQIVILMWLHSTFIWPTLNLAFQVKWYEVTTCMLCYLSYAQSVCVVCVCNICNRKVVTAGRFQSSCVSFSPLFSSPIHSHRHEWEWEECCLPVN